MVCTCLRNFSGGEVKKMLGVRFVSASGRDSKEQISAKCQSNMLKIV